jgi:energy-coupling factor transporter ATP-binding protein EcfA2
MYSHIIHLADIHLRTGNAEHIRKNEYEYVIDQLMLRLQKLKCVQKRTALIVVCGDIFHNKNKLESNTVRLWTRFIKGLTDLAPVVLLCGNHDFRQEDPSCPDLVDVMLEDHTGHQNPCTYLKDTGTYAFDNITFGIVSIKDTLKSYDTFGIVEDLPKFPQCSDTNVHVALFHGTVTQSSLPNGQCMAAGKGYPLEWFNGYDLVLLGDNHKQQVHNSDAFGFSWGYPGSLVQQDISEPVFGHGFLLWDLKSRDAKPYHICNEFGRFRAKIRKDTLLIRVDHNSFVPIQDVVHHPKFPKTPSVQVLGNIGEDVRVRDILSAHNICPSHISTVLQVSGQEKEKEAAHDMNIFLDNISSINHPSKWLDFIELTDTSLANKMKSLQWFDCPENVLMKPLVDDKIPVEFKQKVNDRREKIQAAIEFAKGVRQKTVLRASITLKYFTWSWAFSYGDHNWFNFENMEGHIAVLNGRNASGKSSFIDVLCIAIFGEPGKNRNLHSTRKISSDFLHHQRPPKTAMNTAIMLSVNDEVFEIIRSYTHHESKVDDSMSQIRKCELYCVNRTNQTKTMVCSGATLVDAWVTKNCGTIEDLLRTTVVSQFDNQNFFMLKPNEQKDMIDAALNMEGLKSFAAIIDVAHTSYNYLVDNVATMITALSIPGCSGTNGSQTAVNDTGVMSDMNGTGALVDKCDQLQQEYSSLELQKEMLSAQCANNFNKPPKDSLEILQSQVQTTCDVQELRTRLQQYLQNKQKIQHELQSITPTQHEHADCKYDIDNINIVIAQHKSIEPTVVKLDDIVMAEKLNALWWETNKERISEVDEIDDVLRDAEADHNEWLSMSIPKPDHVSMIDDGDGDDVTKKDVKDAISYYIASKNHINIVEAQLFQNSALYKKYTAYLEEVECNGWENLDLDDCKMKMQLCNSVDRSKIVDDDEWSRVVNVIQRNSQTFSTSYDVQLQISRKIGTDVIIDELRKMKAKFHRNKLCAKFKRAESKVVLFGDAEEKLADVQSQIHERGLLLQCKGTLQRFLKMRGINKTEIQDELYDVKQKLAAYDYGHLMRTQRKYQKQVQLKKSVEFSRQFVHAPLQDTLNERIAYYETLRCFGSEELDELYEQFVFYEEHKDTMKLWLEVRDCIDNDWGRAIEVLTFLDNHKKDFEAHETLKAEYAMQLSDRDEKWCSAYIIWTHYGRVLQSNIDEYRRVAQIAHELPDMEAERHTLIKKRMRACKYMEWMETYKTLEDTKAFLKQKTLEHQLQEVAQQIEIIEYQSNLQSAIAWYKYQDTKTHSSRVQHELLELRNTLANYNQHVAFEKNKACLAIYRDLLRDWSETRDLLGQVLVRLMDKRGSIQANNFKEWVYSNQIIPLLERQLNYFLSAIDTILVRIQYHSKGLRFFLVDKGHETIFAASSGYQQFIVGLAMRQALANIGGTGNNLKHMFIDEGFTACDGTNIEKAHDILQKLVEMGGFTSILIVSHLETIKDVIPTKINIERTGSFSKLRFGHALGLYDVVK